MVEIEDSLTLLFESTLMKPTRMAEHPRLRTRENHAERHLQLGFVTGKTSRIGQPLPSEEWQILQ
jgi:hypothetical protein